MPDLYKFAAPLVRLFDPERAHGLTICALKSGLVPKAEASGEASDGLASIVFGLHFPNPVGLAAGFDKNGEVPDAMLSQGFGFAEIGTVTPKPQKGNPKPRLFRLSEDQAVINRMGFNNEGVEAMAARLKKRAGRGGIVGANLGANKDSNDRVQDYVIGLKSLYGLADYFTINISSPNTPGLRGLQDRDALGDLLARLMATRAELTPKGAASTPLLLKVAPDLEADARADIVELLLAHKFDGLIVSNTTIGLRDALKSPHAHETGGLSGAPLFDLSTEILRDFYRLTEGRLPLIGVGGISSGRDAYEKIKAGASLVQLYSALTFQGPALIGKINSELAGFLQKDGFKSVSEAVGVAAA